MWSTVEQLYKKLDILILNACGGLEQGKAEDYAMALNHSAQFQAANPLRLTRLPSGDTIFVGPNDY